MNPGPEFFLRLLYRVEYIIEISGLCPFLYLFDNLFSLSSELLSEYFKIFLMIGILCF